MFKKLKEKFVEFTKKICYFLESISLNKKMIILCSFFFFLAFTGILALTIRVFSPENNAKSSFWIKDRNGVFLANTEVSCSVLVNPKKVDKKKIEESLKILEIPQLPWNDEENFIIANEISPIYINDLRDRGVKFIFNRARKYMLGKYFTSIGINYGPKGLLKGVEKLGKKSNLNLTIDADLQNYFAEEINKMHKNLGTKACFGVIMNENCEILAMHTSNACDLEDIHDFQNHITHSSYEFGSIFKIFPLWCGIKNKVFNANTIIDKEEGKFIDGRLIEDPVQIAKFSPIKDIIKFSSNQGAITMVKNYIGPNEYLNFLKEIRLLEKIDLGFSYTSNSIISKNSNSDILVMSFGYAICINALNALRAFIAIFNGGKIIKPTLIKSKNIIIENLVEGEWKEVIDILKYTAAKNPFLEKTGCAVKTGTHLKRKKKKEGQKFGDYDRLDRRTFLLAALPIDGEFKYFVLIGVINPSMIIDSAASSRELFVRFVKRILAIV